MGACVQCDPSSWQTCCQSRLCWFLWLDQAGRRVELDCRDVDPIKQDRPAYGWTKRHPAMPTVHHCAKYTIIDDCQTPDFNSMVKLAPKMEDFALRRLCIQKSLKPITGQVNPKRQRCWSVLCWGYSKGTKVTQGQEIAHPLAPSGNTHSPLSFLPGNFMGQWQGLWMKNEIAHWEQAIQNYRSHIVCERNLIDFKVIEKVSYMLSAQLGVHSKWDLHAALQGVYARPAGNMDGLYISEGCIHCESFMCSYNSLPHCIMYSRPSCIAVGVYIDLTRCCPLL